MLTRIDLLLVGEYYHLDESDECWFLREYTAGMGYAHSETNDLILNLKKEPDRKGRPEWRYKERAILRVARELAEALPEEFRRGVTLVPMPPSKSRLHQLYDDRMVRVLRSFPGAEDLDIRELLEVRRSMEPAHLRLERGEKRPRPEEVRRNLRLVRTHRDPAPGAIVLVDDVLTTGAHFKGAKALLLHEFPGVRVVGLFVARVVHPDGDVPVVAL